MIEDFDLPDTSLLIIPLALEQNVVGHMIFVAHGKDRYTPDHAHLVSLLREPFAIAMSNALKHQEVLNSRNCLLMTTDICRMNCNVYVAMRLSGLILD